MHYSGAKILWLNKTHQKAKFFQLIKNVFIRLNYNKNKNKQHHLINEKNCTSTSEKIMIILQFCLIPAG